jgi:CBS domain-containing protein
MTVAAILKRQAYQVTVVGPADRIGDVVEVISAARAEAALVVDCVGQLLGVLAEHDIIASLVVNAAHTLDMTAAQLATPVVKTVNSRASLSEAMRVMTDARRQHLPVEENGELVGLISLTDILRARIIREEFTRAA